MRFLALSPSAGLYPPHLFHEKDWLKFDEERPEERVLECEPPRPVHVPDASIVQSPALEEVELQRLYGDDDSRCRRRAGTPALLVPLPVEYTLPRGKTGIGGGKCWLLLLLLLLLFLFLIPYPLPLPLACR